MEADLPGCIIPLSHDDIQHSGFLLSETASTYLLTSLLNKISLKGLCIKMHVHFKKHQIEFGIQAAN